METRDRTPLSWGLFPKCFLNAKCSSRELLLCGPHNSRRHDFCFPNKKPSLQTGWFA